MTARAPLPSDSDDDVLAQGAKVASAANDLGRFAGLGLQFAATIAVVGGLGWGLDALLGTFPWLLVAGVLGGGVVAFVLLVRAVPSARGRAPGAGTHDGAHDPRS